MAENQINKASDMLKAMADPERLRILRALDNQARYVSEIAAQLESRVANVSHHLGILRHAGLVTAEKKGRHVLYGINESILADAKKAASARSGKLFDFGVCMVELAPPPAPKGKRKS